MSDDLVKRWDEYVESMGCVMGEVEHMAQQMRDRIEAQAAEIERLRGAMQEAIRLAEQPHYGDRGDALDHCFDAIDVLRETLAEQTGGKNE